MIRINIKEYPNQATTFMSFYKRLGHVLKFMIIFSLEKIPQTRTSANFTSRINSSWSYDYHIFN